MVAPHLLLMVSAVDYRAQFFKAFPPTPEDGGEMRALGVATAPGRANLIGEHTDYQEGFVAPFALRGMACTVTYAKRSDSLLRCYAADLDEYAEYDLNLLAAKRREDPGYGGRTTDFPEAKWLRYVAGAFEYMHTSLDSSVKEVGCDIYVTSTVPQGGGLSSSSALTVACSVAARDLYAAEGQLPKVSLLDACCGAEWHFSGVPGGIMDQFASLYGVADKAIVLDCRTKTVASEIDLSGVDLVVINTNVKHDLRDSPFAKRREVCERVAAAANVSFLRDIEGGLETLDALLKDEKISENDHQKATHGVLENDRVGLAADAANKGDWAGLGKLLDEAHASLRDLYDVSCPELDAVQQAASASPHCFGSRMMGGGFGGCVLAVCAKGSGKEVEEAVKAAQLHPIPTIIHAHPGPGAALSSIRQSEISFTPVVQLHPGPLDAI